MPSSESIDEPPKQIHSRIFGKHLLVLLIIFAVLWNLNLNAGKAVQTTSPRIQQGISGDNTYFQEQMDQLLMESPGMTPDYARDEILHSIAISEKNESICHSISNDYIRSDCFRHFEISTSESQYPHAE